MVRPVQRPRHVVTPGPGQESVWDYPRPPRIEAVPERVRVEFAGVTVGDSLHALRVLETASPPVYYLPPADVRTDLLQAVRGTTLCEWKGRAQYWDLRVEDRHAVRAAWSYPAPTTDFARLRDYVAFYPGRVDACFVGPDRVTPQAGAFYGGWITPRITGPFKGEPGTEGW